MGIPVGIPMYSLDSDSSTWIQSMAPPRLLQVPRQQLILGHAGAILRDATGNQLHDAKAHVILGGTGTFSDSKAITGSFPSDLTLSLLRVELTYMS